MLKRPAYIFSKHPIILFFLFFFMIFAVQAQNFIIHKVKNGETLRDIAKNYMLAPSDILKYNGDILPGSKLVAGQSILIPKPETTEKIQDSIKLGGRIIDYKYHTVGENETLFSLSKQYNSKIESIVLLNNVEGFNIKLGQILIIPIFADENAPKQIDTSKYTYYTVQPKQGKWRVAYDHGITIDELERLNPEIKDTDLKVGQNLIVPKFITTPQKEKRDDAHYIYYEVQPKETMYSLSKQYNISIDEMIALNPELKDGLKAGQTIKFPKQNTEENIGQNQNQETDQIVVSENPIRPDTLRFEKPRQINLLDSLRLDKEYKIAILLPFKLSNNDSLTQSNLCNKLINNRILDYYSGIKFAIDSLQSVGMNIQYDVYDTKASPYVTGKILEITDLSDYDFVIGPVKKENIEKVAHFLELDNTPIAVHQYKGDKKYRNIVVTTSTNDILEQHVIQYLKEQADNKAIHIIYTEDMQKKADTIATQIGKKVTLIKGKKTKKGFSINAEKVANKLPGNRENIVLLITNDSSFTFSVLSTLNGLTDTKRISLFTLNDQRLYEDTTNDRMNTFLANLHYHFPAKMIRMVKPAFSKKYKSVYNVLPSFTAINGFDTTYDLLLRAGNADNLFEGLQKIGRTVQSSKTYLYHHSPEEGFFNQGSVILYINPKLELKIAE